MLARRRGYTRDGRAVIGTPLLVPSFSSKGFSDPQSILAVTEPIIDSSILISAYDVHYGSIGRDVDFAESIILDSGGYESGVDLDLSEVSASAHAPSGWTRAQYAETLESWDSSRPTIFVSFDHHLDRVPVAEQVRRAHEDIPRGAIKFSELLLKPETAGAPYLDMDAVLSEASRLVSFDAIGVTEKEIGDTMLARMTNIARLRRALEREGGADIPIHVFGSLDTISTPLYQIAGADVFDGLTWLRYAFNDGLTVYRQNYAALHLGLGVAPDVMAVTIWFNNFRYLQDLQLQMRAYAETGEIKSFHHNQEAFAGALEALKSSIGD